jgi:DNA-binding MarR family transcriptional regulator
MLQSPHPRYRRATRRQAIDRALAVLEQRRLSPTEVRVLLNLLDREASLVDVANALGHSPRVITRAAGGLDSRGLVRWFHAADTKESRLAITADGLAATRALLAAADLAAGEAPPREAHDSMRGSKSVLLTGGSRP